MKIKIKDIEEKLNYKIKRNFNCLSIDTAQITGICFLKTDKENLFIDHLVLSFKTKDKREVYHTMVKTFEKLFNDEDLAIIEEVFVGFSRAGSVELAKYGSFAIAECIKKDIPYETIGATSARSKFKINTRKYGKGKSKQAVAEFVESLGINFTDNNLVDAFVLGLCGLCEGISFVAKSKTKKKSTKKKTTKKKAVKRK